MQYISLKYIRRTLFIFSLLALLCLQSVSLPAVEFAPINMTVLSIRRNQGKSLASESSYTTLETLYFPFDKRNVYPFVDFRVHSFDQKNRYAANIGIGARYYLPDSDKIFGINTYFDYRNKHHFNTNQFGIGLEYLRGSWNFRLNGYLPVGKKNMLRSFYFYDEYDNGYFYLEEKIIRSLKGFDFEVEMILNDISLGNFYKGNFCLAIGTYYYQGKGCHKNIFGSQYRLSTVVSNHFNLALIATNDTRFNTRVQLELTFPFSLQSDFQEETSVFQQVRRQEIIVTENCNRWTWNW